MYAPGTHHMEPPSLLIFWVNPFPSRFTNGTACLTRKVSCVRESRMSPWKNRVGWSRTQKPILRPFFLFYYTSSFTILRPLGSGYHKKLMNYPTETEHKAMWQRQRTEDHWKVIFGSVFFPAILHSTCKHALRKESTIKRSVDDLELFDDHRLKSARIICLLSSPWSGFRQLHTACEAMT